MDIKKQIENYSPFNEQEENDKKLLLKLIDEPQVFTRENKMAHFTASAWVVDPKFEKVLMIYHNIYDSWAWMGGHADGETDLFNTARREAIEESGITKIEPVSEDIFSLEVLTVSGHEKKGKYVSSHLHLNLTYVFKAPFEQELFIKPDENSGVMWIDIDEVLNKSNEKWFCERIYPKLIDKTKKLRAQI